ncbi:hypothetical protein PPS11_07940 [Pseudomonas putida S11]|nr:hypothetical protein PPS11_07940 [Pseudomonas putida S11]
MMLRQPSWAACSTAWRASFQGGVGGLVNLDGEERGHGLQVVVDVVVAEHGHLGGAFAGLPQCP